MEHLATPNNFGNVTTGTDACYFVAGRPVPQGSLKFINGHAIHERAQDLALWRADIANGARSLNIDKIIGGAEVYLTFAFTKPKTVKRDEPFVRPDIDKLCRAVLDGLTGVAFDDDQQVTHLTARKIYAEKQGVHIRIVNRNSK
jgi:crossover junction endodeoxyribonuclease RusA